jgi:hypothetical protein
MRLRAPALLAAAVLLLQAAPALAQDGGVFIDPGSPSAKEYGIPLETARRQANPGADPNAPIPQGAPVSPLFGEGISGSTARTKPGRDGFGSGGAEGGGPSGSSSSVTPPQVIQAAGNPGTPSGATSTPVVVGGIALGVLLLSGGTGLLLRRRRS